MKDNNQNDDFVEKCRRIDFSAESVNKDKNLEILKTRMIEIQNEGEDTMKRTRKSFAITVAAAILVCLPITVYGQDIVKALKSVFIGDHAQFITMEQPRGSLPLPTALEGKLFDADGNALTAITQGEAFYNADGAEACIYQDSDGNLNVLTVDEYNKTLPKIQYVEFDDFDEASNHFISNVLKPCYLPDGYSFQKAVFMEEDINNGASKFMDVFYTNGTEDILCSLRFMDEETAFVSRRGYEPEEIKINGHEAVIIGVTLYVQIEDVLYEFYPNENVDVSELVKIAESLE